METLKNYSYYREQLEGLNLGEYAPSLQIRSNSTQTNWLNINQESAPILKRWLKQFEPQPTQQEKERDLYSEVDRWVNSNFNFIPLLVFEKMADDNLQEYIRQPKPNLMQFLYDYDLVDDCSLSLSEEEGEEIELSTANIEQYEDQVKDWIDENAIVDFEDFMDEQENYPMWCTIFEFRHEPSEDIIEACEKAGFGIIEGLDDFNTSLFVSGCGYSFYGAHWIPAYLGWNERAKEDYTGIKYDHL